MAVKMSKQAERAITGRLNMYAHRYAKAWGDEKKRDETILRVSAYISGAEVAYGQGKVNAMWHAILKEEIRKDLETRYPNALGAERTAA